jgi:hypothetical protein
MMVLKRKYSMDQLFTILLLAVVLVPPLLLAIGTVADFARRKLIEMRKGQRMAQALRRGLILRDGA